jgi:tetratricopeptide (TPR) repeat protein
MRLTRLGPILTLIPALTLALASTTLVRAAAPLSPGFEHFYNLEYDQALADFHAEAAAHPESPDAWNHVAQGIIFRALFRAGALDTSYVSDSNPFFRRPALAISSQDEMTMLSALDRATDLARATIAKHPNDVPALYALGVTYGLRADYAFLVKKAWIGTLRDITTARKFDAQVLDLDPSNIDARTLPGLYDYVTGSLVFPWKQLGFLAGFHGDKERGIKTLKLVAEQGTSNRVDAAFILEAILRRDHRPAEALPVMDRLAREFPRNYLFALERAYLYSDMNQKDEALKALSEMESAKHRDAPGYASLPEEKLHFARGTILFRFGVLDQALDELQAATAGGAGLDHAGLNHAGLNHHDQGIAWLIQGQIHDLKKQRRQAQESYRQAIRIYPDTDTSTSAKKFLSSPYRG